MLARVYIRLLVAFSVLPLNVNATAAVTDSSSQLAEHWREQIQKPVMQAVQLGEEAAAWQQQKAQSLSQQQQDLGELYWTEYQLQKQQRYLASLQAEVAQLQQDIATISALKQELEPQLEIWYAMLERQVSSDLPFDFDERKRRLAFLRTAMDSHDLPLAERFRRLLDVMTIEVAYGYGQQLTQEVIAIDEQPVQVNLLRLGRLSWFYITPDEQHLGWFDIESRQWRPLPVDQQGDIKVAMAITANKQVAQIVNLPLGGQEQ